MQSVFSLIAHLSTIYTCSLYLHLTSVQQHLVLYFTFYGFVCRVRPHGRLIVRSMNWFIVVLSTTAGGG